MVLPIARLELLRDAGASRQLSRIRRIISALISQRSLMPHSPTPEHDHKAGHAHAAHKPRSDHAHNHGHQHDHGHGHGHGHHHDHSASRYLPLALLLTLGFAGVYSTFLLHAKRAEARFGVSARDILVELGRKKMIGGQEDMIEDTAMTMAKERGLLKVTQREEQAA